FWSKPKRLETLRLSREMRAALTTLSEKSQESNDNATDATDDWAVSGRVGRRRLLHAFNWASRRRGTCRWSSRIADGPWADGPVRGPRLVAVTVCLNAILCDHVVRRACHLVSDYLPSHLV